MADVIPNVVISMPSQLFTLARKFQAVSNGKIFIGKIDSDPTIPENQIQVYLENEDGTTVPVPQPLIINQAGYPVYNGQIAKFVTVQGHSMAVYDSYGAQQFYYPNVLKYDPDQFEQRFREELKSNLGAEMIGTESGKTVQESLIDLNNKNGLSLSNVRIIKELPVRPEKEFKDLVVTYSYADVYPQGMYMHGNDIFINNTAYGDNAKNNWDWIYVYDRNSYELKSVFSAGNNNAEGLVIYEHDGIRYLFILERWSQHGSGQTGVYQLPDDLSSINMKRLSPIKIHDTHQYYQIGGNNNKLVIQVNYGDSAADTPQRKSRYVYYDAVDMITSDNPKSIGSYSLDPNLVKVGKLQGVGMTDTGLLHHGGGYYYQPNYPVNQNTMYALHKSTQTGDIIESVSCRADEVIEILRPHLKVSPKRLEAQGAICFNEKIYTINLLGSASPIDEFAGGLVILEHNLSSNEEGVLKLSNAAYPLGAFDHGNDVNIQVQSVSVDRSQNKRINKLKDILDVMVRDGVNSYAFYNNFAPLVTDLNDNELPPEASISITNNSSISFVIDIKGKLINYTLHVKRDKDGNYTQMYSTVVELGFTNLRPEFASKPHKIQGVDGSVREDIYTNSDGRSAAFRFYSADKSSTCGSIIVDGAAKKTDYLTTSDMRLKFTHGVDKYIPDLISEAVSDGAAQYAAFKSNPENIYPMCMAQILHKYFPEAVHVGDSTPENPWMVDASKLVPALMIAIAQLNGEIKKKG